MAYLIDNLTAVERTIDKVMALIRDDNADECRRFIEPNTADSSPLSCDSTLQCGKYSQHYYINVQIKRTLLQYAVSYYATQCVRMLVNFPFCWNVDLPNLFQHTPFSIALDLKFIPVVYELAVHSKEIYTWKRDWVSHASLLVYPDWYMKSFDSTEALSLEFLNYSMICRTFEGTFNYNAFVNYTILLFEILVSDDTSVVGQTLHKCLHTPSLYCDIPLKIALHFVDDSDHALLDIPRATTDMYRKYYDYQDLIYRSWAYHRTLADCDDETEVKQNHCPLQLVELCRVVIRRQAARYFRHQTFDNATSRLNYVSWLKMLKLPPFIHKFLCYNELWPLSDGHVAKH